MGGCLSTCSFVSVIALRLVLVLYIRNRVTLCRNSSEDCGVRKRIKLYYLQFSVRVGCWLLFAVVNGLLSLCSFNF